MYSPSRPMWLQLPMVTRPTPLARARPATVSVARCAAGCPHPHAPSTRMHASPSDSTWARAAGLTRPVRALATYEGSLITPCESCPARLASTNDAATIEARSTGVPTASRIAWPSRFSSAAWSRMSCSAARLTASATADERHLGRHDGHELDICVQGQAGHIEDRPRYMLDVDPRFRQDRAVWLFRARRKLLRQLGRCVADVDLAARDVELPAVE